MRLKKIYILVSLIIFITGYNYGQPINADFKNQGYIFINHHTEYLATQDELSFSEVLLPGSQAAFKNTTGKNVAFKGYDPYHYWYRFSIANKDSVSTKSILILGQLGLKDAELWQGHNGVWHSLGKTGYQYNFKSRPYLFVHYAYPITVEANNTDSFYISLDESHAYKVVAFALLQPKAMKRMENRFYFLFGIFTGILLFFSLTNIYLYFSIKEKIHLWYSLYIITMLFFMLKHEGLDSQFLGLDSFYGYRLTSMRAFGLLAVGFLIKVVQLFLTNILPGSKLYKVTSIVMWLMWIAAFAQWLVFLIEPNNTIEVAMFTVSNSIGFLGLGIIVLNCVYSYIQGFKPSLFIFAGLFVFLTGILLRTLFIVFEKHIFPPSLFEVGLVSEAIIISFGLMYRYNMYKKEKENLQATLENQASDAAKQILFTQQAEQTRIAQDLHDELGGNLAAIKMTLQSFELPPAQLENISNLIDNASNNARNIAHNLMPPEFEEVALTKLINNYYEKLTGEHTCKFRFYSSGSSTFFDKQKELMIYRIFMELSNNIIKHSQASEATLQLIYYDTYLEIMAEDNGIGMKDTETKGIGLRNINSRVAYMKGKINIDSSRSGTTFMIQIPYN